jgi:dolichyl-phosphate-mannose--protein O-mannosyl transferase
MKRLILCSIIGTGLASPDAVTFGSAVKLVSSTDSKFFLRSVEVQWNNRPQGHNIVTTAQDETSPDIYWVIAPVDVTSTSGQNVKCGSTVQLRHAMTGRLMHVNTKQRSTLANMHEVTAVTKEAGEADKFLVECEGSWEKGKKVSLKHLNSGGYLRSQASWLYTQSNCPRCPIVGQREVGVGSGRCGNECSWSVEGGVIVREPEEEAGSDSSEGNTKDEL